MRELLTVALLSGAQVDRVFPRRWHSTVASPRIEPKSTLSTRPFHGFLALIFPAFFFRAFFFIQDHILILLEAAAEASKLKFRRLAAHYVFKAKSSALPSRHPAPDGLSFYNDFYFFGRLLPCTASCSSRATRRRYCQSQHPTFGIQNLTELAPEGPDVGSVDTKSLEGWRRAMGESHIGEVTLMHSAESELFTLLGIALRWNAFARNVKLAF